MNENTLAIIKAAKATAEPFKLEVIPQAVRDKLSGLEDPDMSGALLTATAYVYGAAGQADDAFKAAAEIVGGLAEAGKIGRGKSCAMTQDKYAEISGVAKQTISNMVTGYAFTHNADANDTLRGLWVSHPYSVVAVLATAGKEAVCRALKENPNRHWTLIEAKEFVKALKAGDNPAISRRFRVTARRMFLDNLGATCTDPEEVATYATDSKSAVVDTLKADDSKARIAINVDSKGNFTALVSRKDGKKVNEAWYCGSVAVYPVSAYERLLKVADTLPAMLVERAIGYYGQNPNLFTDKDLETLLNTAEMFSDMPRYKAPEPATESAPQEEPEPDELDDLTYDGNETLQKMLI